MVSIRWNSEAIARRIRLSKTSTEGVSRRSTEPQVNRSQPLVAKGDASGHMIRAEFLISGSPITYSFAVFTLVLEGLTPKTVGNWGHGHLWLLRSDQKLLEATAPALDRAHATSELQASESYSKDLGL